MIIKNTPDERLLDAELEFIMNAPQEYFDAYLAEMNGKATLAFDRALKSHQETNKASQALAGLTVPQQKVVVSNLGVRRQVLTAFREHRVDISSVPAKFLRQLAAELGQAVDSLARALLGPAPAALAGSHKSDEKPDAAPKRVTFGQLLREADMSEEEISQLMRDGD